MLKNNNQQQRRSLDNYSASFSGKYFINAHFLGQEIGHMSPDNLNVIKLVSSWVQDKVKSISSFTCSPLTSKIFGYDELSHTTKCYEH